MPELPEVETVRRGLEPVMVGQTIVRLELRRANLRFPFPDFFADNITLSKINALERRAKYLLMSVHNHHQNKEYCVIMHLGMSGRFRVEHAEDVLLETAFHHPQPIFGKHDHVIFHLSNGARIIYNDTRRFGFMDCVTSNAREANVHIKHLGIEPLSNVMNAHTLARLCVGRSTSLKAALLDQRLIAGLGNIYVCEALFRAQLSPTDPASMLADAQGEPTSAAIKLAPIIIDVLNEALAAGGSTLRDFSHADGDMGYFQHAFKVYDREEQQCVAPQCKGVIARFTQNGRSTYYCPSCQQSAYSKPKSE